MTDVESRVPRVAIEPLPDTPVPLDVALGAAAAAMHERWAESRGDVRAIALAGGAGVELVLVQAADMEGLRMEMLRLFQADLALVGPVFQALDELVDAPVTDAGVPVLVMIRGGSRGLQLEHARLPRPAAGGSA